MPNSSPHGGVRGFRNFAIFYAGTQSVAIGLWMHRLAVAWLAWEITGSGFWLGLIATADLLPSILLGPPAGILADRFDRKRLTGLCQTVNVLLVLGLFGVTRSGAVDHYVLLLFALANGVIAGVQQPVRMSLAPELVDKSQIGRAAALMSLNAHLGRLIGPILLGPVLHYQEVSYAFLYSAGFYAVLVVLLPFLRHSDRTREVGAWTGLRTEFLAGFRYAASHPTIGPILLSFLLVSVFGRPVFELLPAIVDTFFERGPLGLSWLAGAVGAGTVLCSLWLVQRPAARSTLSCIVGFMLVFGIAALTLTQVSHFGVAVLLAAIAGFAVTATTIGAMAAIQIAVPGEIRGRVVGIYGAAYRAAPAVGAIAMGALTDVVGLRWPIAIGAGICLVWWLVMTLLHPRIEARAAAAGD